MAECENKGCIRIKKGEHVDIPVENTPLLYCPDDDGPGHPEHIWRVTNTTNKTGFIFDVKEGYTGTAPTQHDDTLTAHRGEWMCKEGGAGEYLFPAPGDPADKTQVFKMYWYCRDRKCRPA